MYEFQPGRNPLSLEPTFLAMSEKRRKFTKEQKMHILQQVKQYGVTKVLGEYNLSYSVYHRWKQNALKYTDSINAEQLAEEMKRLREENKALKRIIADLALQIEMRHSSAND